MQNELTNISNLTDAIRDAFTVGNGHFRQSHNAIVEYLIDDHIESGYWDSVESIASDLEMAHCAAGSFSGMIYTQDILDRLGDPDWRDAIEVAIDSYLDATGESPEFDRDCMGYRDTFRIENLVTFAVDWMSNEIASYIRSLDRVYIVTEYADHMDTNPERIVYLDESDAMDHVGDSIHSRVDFRVSHSPYTVTEDERDQWEEEESELVTYEVESM